MKSDKMKRTSHFLFAVSVASTLILSFGLSAFSADAEKKPEKQTEKQPEKQPVSKAKAKATDVSFEDMLVQGKYHFSDEAVTTVEDDKVLDALLGVRTDFKDRMKKSASRH